MRYFAMLSVCAIVLLVWGMPAYADFYKWVDRDGKEFYTNDKEKIPAEYRASASSVEVRDDRVSVGKSPTAAAGSPAVSEHKDKYGRGEEYWRKRAENLRRQIREKQDDYDTIVQKEHDRESKSARTSSRSRSKKSSASRDKKKTALEKKIARLKHELEVELPEEARKADAYPGWLRD